MKKIIFLFIVIFLGYTIFTYSAIDGASCEPEDIQKIVENIYQKKNKTPEARAMMKKIEDNAIKYDLSEEDKKSLVYSNLEMAVRTKNKCKVSSSLRGQITQGYNTEGNKFCAEFEYTGQAQQQFNQMRAEDNYQELEAQVYQNILSDMYSPKGKNAFIEKWKDNSFREMVITADLDTKLREANGCKNAVLPAAKLIEELMKEVLQ